MGGPYKMIMRVCKCVSTYACANKHFAKFLWKLYKGFIMMKLFAESKKTSSCGPFEMALSGCRHNIYIWTVSS